MSRKSGLDIYLEATDAYLRDLTANGASPQTVKTYSTHLSYFYDFMVEDAHPSPTSTVVLAWKSALREKGCATSTIKQYLSELQRFFNWTVDSGSGYYEENPITKYMRPRTSSTVPYEHLLTMEDIQRLIENKPVLPFEATVGTWPRNYAIVLVLLTTGIRNAELLDLNLEDVNLNEMYLTVRRGKGGKYRVVCFPEITRQAIENYLALGYRPEDAPADAPLFGVCTDETGRHSPAGQWRRASTCWLSDLVERHVYTITGKEGFRSHSLRHACSMALLNNGVSMEEIQSILGHSSITTTQVYTGRIDPKKAGERATAVFDELNFQKQRDQLRRVAERERRQAAKCAL